MNIDLRHARSFAERCARDLAPFLREGLGAAPVVDRKSDDAFDVVTRFDREADERLQDMLGGFDAAIGFEGEEVGMSGSRDTYWLVDPIDGTAHYVRGNPFCTSMIALIDNGEVVVSVINDFAENRVFSAATGQGATRNGEPIKVADRSMSEAYVGIEINATIGDNAETLRRVVTSLTFMSTVTCGWDFSSTACGRIDGRIQIDPWGSTWDFAPGSLLVKEAGGVVANIGTTAYDFHDLSFLATGPTLFRELTEGPNAMFPLS